MAAGRKKKGAAPSGPGVAATPLELSPMSPSNSWLVSGAQLRAQTPRDNESFLKELEQVYGIYHSELDLGWSNSHNHAPETDPTNLTKWILAQAVYFTIVSLVTASLSAADNLADYKPALQVVITVIAIVVWLALYTVVVHWKLWLQNVSGQGQFWIFLAGAASLGLILYFVLLGQFYVSDAMVLWESGVVETTVQNAPLFLGHRGLYHFTERFEVGIPEMVGIHVDCGSKRAKHGNIKSLRRNVCIAPLVYPGWNRTQDVSAWAIVAGSCDYHLDCFSEWRNGETGELWAWHETWKHAYADNAERVYGIGVSQYEKTLLDLSPLNPAKNAPSLYLLSSENAFGRPSTLLFCGVMYMVIGIFSAFTLQCVGYWFPWANRIGDPLGHTCLRLPEWTLIDLAIFLWKLVKRIPTLRISPCRRGWA